MTRNYFDAMWRCGAVSLGVLVAATLFRLSPIISTGGAILPLVFYHFGYLTPQAKNGQLSHTAIDSVYYFGFLITIAALGISAISIAIQGEGGDINTVVYQFGIGLAATGYAVVARLHLTSVSTNVDDASPEALMDRYVKRSVELVTNVEMAADQLAQFSTSIIGKTAEVTETARATAEKTMLDMAKVFEAEIKSTLAMARDNLTTIRGLVNETAFTAEREELVRSMKSTVEAATLLNVALNELSARTREGAQATRETSVSSASANKAMEEYVRRLSAFGGEDGLFVKASDSLAISTKTIASCSASMAEAAVGLTELAGAVADTGPTFKNMRTVTKKAAEQLDNLVEASTKLGGASENLMAVALATDSLSAGIGKAASALEPLAGQAETLAVRFARAGDMSTRLEGSLSSLPQHAAGLQAMSNETAESLGQICQVIQDAVKQSASLAMNTGETARAMEAATRLVTTAAALESTVSSLQGLFGGLSTSVLATQKALADSSQGIATSITRSSDSLESDVARSAKAAALLTERLVQVAQHIIDQTRQVETA
jgi:hypothetical protein